MKYSDIFPTRGVKVNIVLLLVALVSSIGAWIFWFYTGEYGLDIFAVIILIVLFAENYFLKKEVKKLREKIKISVLDNKK